jgi:serine/threonine protein kinase/Tol biopolymer transport system component
LALNPGTRLGPYEITALLGVGGMGEVYRATDTNLKRQVAVKVLPAAVAADPERLARFQREAEILAALNHPNIAHIHGLEKSDGTLALAMELVEGPTLADRIENGAIPTSEALSIAKQIAEALEAAHDQGIVHRDLKPANIKVCDDGTVKVLDFGLAKAMEPTGVMSSSVSMSPTRLREGFGEAGFSPAMTQAGMILGTAAYMSPEQAKGRTADKRSDVWAFGCVLYEMLTGHRAFGGEDVSDTLAHVLMKEPDLSALPANVPASIRTLLQGCLEKDRNQRFRDISVAQFLLREKTVVTPAARPRERMAWLSVVAVLILVLAGFAVWASRPVAPPLETRLEITTPMTTDPESFAISPDGRQLVFVASGEDGGSHLWVRPLDATTAQSLPGTEDAVYPFWSPDSRSIGFYANRALKRLDLGTGRPRTIAEANTTIRRGAWSPDNVILSGGLAPGPLFRVPASGGDSSAVTTLADGQISHRNPTFLPGGRKFLFYARGTPSSSGIYLGSLDAPGTTRLTEADAAGVYASGWVFFVRQGSLVAQRLDIPHAVLLGDPVTVADAIDVNGPQSFAALSVSSSGLVAFRSSASTSRLTWFDRTGHVMGMIGTRDEQGMLHPRLSPDGHTVVMDRTTDDNTDLWLVDPVHTTRLTTDPATDQMPLWSPNGQQIVFGKLHGGLFDLYVKSSDPASREDPLLTSSETKAPQSWSPDGRSLLYLTRHSSSAGDLWVLPLEGERKPYPFVNTPFEERGGAFSPDGHWVAYQSDKPGRSEIYIKAFPGPGPETLVSTAGGITPQWSPDGKEVYFIAPDSTLMAVPITVHGASVEPGLPTALFQTRIVGGGTTRIGLHRQFDVARDGRFLINTITNNSASAPITIIQNWAGLRQK